MSRVSSEASLAVDGGDLIYVLVQDKAAFDAIGVPAEEGKCLSKSVIEGKMWVIFQYWP